MNKSVKKVPKLLVAGILLSAIIITLSSCSSSNDSPNEENLNLSSDTLSNESSEETSSKGESSSVTLNQNSADEIHSSSEISSKTQSQKTSSTTSKASDKKANSTASKPTSSSKPVTSSKPTQSSKPVTSSKPTQSSKPVTSSKPITPTSSKPTTSENNEYIVKTGNSTVTVYLNSDNAKATEMFNIINKERETAGVSQLKLNSSLTTPALQRAAEITVSWGHTRPDGTEWHTISDQAHGENIASGYTSASSAMDGFMNSTGHRENILRDNFNSVSIACGVSDGKYYWVQLFSNN